MHGLKWPINSTRIVGMMKVMRRVGDDESGEEKPAHGCFLFRGRIALWILASSGMNEVPRGYIETDRS